MDTTKRDAHINVRVNSNIKLEAEKILKSINLRMTDAINIFLLGVVKSNGLPFDINDLNKSR